jgi:hypothetical protein
MGTLIVLWYIGHVFSSFHLDVGKDYCIR